MFLCVHVELSRNNNAYPISHSYSIERIIKYILLRWCGTYPFLAQQPPGLPALLTSHKRSVHCIPHYLEGELLHFFGVIRINLKHIFFVCVNFLTRFYGKQRVTYLTHPLTTVPPPPVHAASAPLP